MVDWNEILTDVLVAIVLTFVPVFLSVVLAWLKPYLNSLNYEIEQRIGKEQWAMTKALVMQFVMAAEQRGVWDDMLKSGKDKKDWVLDMIDQYLYKYGIDLDMDEIDSAIEQAVLDVKWQNGKNGAP